jgi:hypothetical protein
MEVRRRSATADPARATHRRREEIEVHPELDTRSRGGRSESTDATAAGVRQDIVATLFRLSP